MGKIAYLINKSVPATTAASDEFRLDPFSAAVVASVTGGLQKCKGPTKVLETGIHISTASRNKLAVNETTVGQVDRHHREAHQTRKAPETPKFVIPAGF